MTPEASQGSAPCGEQALVYADWLEAHGEALMAAGYRLLGGAGGGDSEVEEWVALSAVAVASHQLARVLRPEADAHDVHEVHETIHTVHAAIDALAATAASARASRGELPAWEPFGEVAPTKIAPEHVRRLDALLRAIERLRAFARGEADVPALVEAVSLARASARSATFHRALGYVLRSAAATGKSPLQRDASLATALGEPFTDDDVRVELPLAGASRLRFARVMITNASQGIDLLVWPRQPGVGPRAAFCALAACDQLDDDGYAEMDAAERLAWLAEDHFPEELEWLPQGNLDFLQWALHCESTNEGADLLCAPGDHRPVIEVLDSFGPLLRGASTPAYDFPFSFYELESVWLYSQLTY